MLNEIEEFYSYVEMPQVAENMKAWEGSFQGGALAVPKHPHPPPNLTTESLLSVQNGSKHPSPNAGHT